MMSASHTLTSRELADRMVNSLGATVLEAVHVPPQTARLAEAPERYQSGALGDWLTRFLEPSTQPYLHQSRALRELDEGRNVVVSTTTASGKSLVFIAAVMAHLIDGHGTALAFYPLKALASDQRASWERELKRAGLPRHLVGEITGDVPMVTRERIIERSRVILATPDVINAWLMPMTSAPDVRRFLAQLSLVIIDEAHTLEAVFGSQFALFFRRLRAAHRRARRR